MITTDEQRQQLPETTAVSAALAPWREPTSAPAWKDWSAPSTASSSEASPCWPGWKWQALHDSLTGLPNRRMIEERLQQAVHNASRTDTPVTVLFLDLDGFGEINRSLGHGGGDHVLRVVASRLLKETRSTDTVGRLGGDEFVVVMDAAPGRAAWAAAERIRAAVSEPIVLPNTLDSGQAVTVTVSIGLADARKGHPQHLLHRSDLAMFAAKAQGGDCVLADPARRLAS